VRVSESVFLCAVCICAFMAISGSGASFALGRSLTDQGRSLIDMTVLSWIYSDDNFLRVFRHAICNSAAVFVPDVVVLQCGADALVGDPLGEFNLTQKGLCVGTALCCISASL
jgi:hypothetical protein